MCVDKSLQICEIDDAQMMLIFGILHRLEFAIITATRVANRIGKMVRGECMSETPHLNVNMMMEETQRCSG